WITTEPSACFATRPVSTVKSLSPSFMDSLRYFLTGIFLSPSDNDLKPFRHASVAIYNLGASRFAVWFFSLTPRRDALGNYERKNKGGTSPGFRELMPPFVRYAKAERVRLPGSFAVTFGT